MNKNSGIKQRREERIQQLIAGGQSKPHSSGVYQDRFGNREMKPMPVISANLPRDPETEWKNERQRWHQSFGENRRPSFWTSFWRRTVMATVLFGMVWGLFHWDIPYAVNLRMFIADSLKKDMDFAAARQWYGAYFDGAPSFLPIFGEETEAHKVNAGRKASPPIEGDVTQPFALSLKGVEITPSVTNNGAVAVKSIDAGRVLDISNHPKSGITITIRHTGGITATYGRISRSTLKVNDWVQEGDEVGVLPASRSADEAVTLFFAVQRGDQYIDPTEVVALD
ncbi:M23 family metallopeptidase [Paenibacillus sp. 1-18]|uniref:M23 family metallopeptidase n=1 Tax=Paenibacillus sp. 1-18 TaxID=1333846 RepID=UPI000472234F|nr:M23 family metallopeptidase [Paenibacillus sp. 1-18]